MCLCLCISWYKDDGDNRDAREHTAIHLHAKITQTYLCVWGKICAGLKSKSHGICTKIETYILERVGEWVRGEMGERRRMNNKISFGLQKWKILKSVP